MGYKHFVGVADSVFDNVDYPVACDMGYKEYRGLRPLLCGHFQHPAIGVIK